MKAALLYRIASVLLIFFAAGHTYGFLKFKPPSSEGAVVWDAMNSEHFQVKGANYSYGGFYVGFGLFATAYLLFSAYLAWHLGGMARINPKAIGTLGWAFFTLQVAGTVLSWKYFFPPPAVISALVAACVGLAAWLVTGSQV